MAKDLFQISKAKDIYLTMDLHALLSPRLSRETDGKSSLKQDRNESEKQHEGDTNETNQG